MNANTAATYIEAHRTREAYKGTLTVEQRRTMQAISVALDDEMERKDAQLINAEFIRWDVMVVLVEWRGEFVTWKFGGSGCYYGHYHTTFREAASDFRERVSPTI